MRTPLVLGCLLSLTVACSDSTAPKRSAPAYEIVVSPDLPQVGIGDTLRLTAVVRDSNGNTLSKTVTWESSDESRVTVDANGLVTAHDFGESVISASVDGRSGVATVIVQLSLAQISANSEYACGITRTGRAYCWGNNDYGELGNGDDNGLPRFIPTRIATTVAMKQVTTGPYHACALSTAGAAYCWGWNIIGQLGIGTYDATGGAHATPVPVVGGKVFTSLTAGFYHTCGTVANGDVYCWGDNELAILGSGGTETCTLPTETGSIAIPCGRTPRIVAGGANLASISAGSYHTCGISATGEVHCWGDNSVGQRGIGTVDTVTRFQSTLVSGGGSYSTVVSGDGYSCALSTTGGQAWCWGYNEVASLGIGAGDTLSHPAPLQVVGGSGLTSLSTTWYHVCGATTAGPSLCWGLNGDGQAGSAAGLCNVRDGTGSTFDIPCITSATAITSPVSFVSLSPSLYSTCGRTARSGVYCWGWNGYGQLGNGSQAPSATPVPIFGSPLGSEPPPAMGASTMAARSRLRLEKGLLARSRALLITRAAEHLR